MARLKSGHHSRRVPRPALWRYPVALAFSKANFQRSRAASSAEFCKSGSGGRGIRVVISPISTFSASLSLFLGELSGRVIETLVDGCDRLAGVGVRRAPERRPRAT